MSKKIYLIEDDSAIIDIYETVMKKAHLDVDVISSGQEAIKKIKSVAAGEEQKPDLVLMDLILPDMNGVEILREIRDNPKTKDITVFVLSNQEKLELPEGDPIKPDKFIIKANITPTQLLEVIKKELN